MPSTTDLQLTNQIVEDEKKKEDVNNYISIIKLDKKPYLLKINSTIKLLLFVRIKCTTFKFNIILHNSVQMNHK